MKNLQSYTDEQLREELKRRANERRKNATLVVASYKYLYAVVDAVWCKLGAKYLPFEQWSYRLVITNNDNSDMWMSKSWKCKKGVFKKVNSPKVGDTVKLRYRKTKKKDERFDIDKAQIIEIVKRKEE